MNKISLFSVTLFSFGILSCSQVDNSLRVSDLSTNAKTLTSKEWKIEKVKQLIKGEYKIVYDRNASLLDVGNDFSSLRLMFLKNKTLKIFSKSHEDSGIWDFINHESQLRSKKDDQKSFLILHINRIEPEELVLTQMEDGKIIQYDFSPM